MDLHRVGSRPGQRAGQDHRPHHEVVRERDVGRRHGPHGLHVGVDVVLELGVRELREGLGVESLVLVGHVDGQHPPDVRDVHRHAVGRLVVAVLAEQVHLVPERRERPHEVRVVDVAAGAAEQIAMEDQDPHAPLLFRADASPPEVQTACPL